MCSSDLVRFHEHPGVELLYVISGKVEIHTQGARHQLSEGDAVYFDASVPHAYGKGGNRRATALVVTTTLK